MGNVHTIKSTFFGTLWAVASFILRLWMQFTKFPVNTDLWSKDMLKLRNIAKGLCISNCFCTIKLLSDCQTGNNMSLIYMETSSNLLQLKITYVIFWYTSVYLLYFLKHLKTVCQWFFFFFEFSSLSVFTMKHHQPIKEWSIRGIMIQTI